MPQTKKSRAKKEAEEAEQQADEAQPEEEAAPEDEAASEQEPQPEEEQPAEEEQPDEGPSLADQGELELKVKKHRIDISIPRDGNESATLDRLAGLFDMGEDG